MIHRRNVCKFLGSSAFPSLSLGSSLVSAAQNDKPVTLVVPYAPGGTSDMLGRLIAQQLSERSGRNVVVENRAGAGTALGASQVARATPDGDTLLLATSTTLAINPTLYRKLTYDPIRDFAPIGLVAAVAFAVVVHPSLRVKSLADLVRLSKDKPDALSYGSAGNGSPHHLIAEMFKAATGASMRHVPYKGAAPALNDLLGGQINVMFCDLAPALPHIKAGTIQALAVTTAGRQPSLPDVPTITESGITGTQGFDASAWQGIVAPAGTPSTVVSGLHRELNTILASQPVRTKLLALEVEPRASTSPDEFAAYIKSEAERWGKVIKAAGATVD